MPLHLLGKKSWNVYNADNIARVRRDEAAAAAEEHAAEQRMQDADAARRLAILRGESPPPPPPSDAGQLPADPFDKKYLRRDRDRDGNWLGGARKRKRAGEDDTDFEMRVARERAEDGDRVRGELAVGGRNEKEGEAVDIVDSRGHIDLVGGGPKDAGEHKEGKTREGADRQTFGSFRDEVAGKPWYTDTKRRRVTAGPDTSTALVLAATTRDRETERGMEAPTTNVWGKDDPKRRGRETARLDASDPLAAMKSGAKKVREIAKERKRDAEERERELEQLRKEERRREKRRRRDREHGDEGRDDDEHGGHRSGRSERRRHGDERREERRDHGHREERRRHKESEHSRDREDDRHHRRDGDRSRERGTSSRSHRHRDRDDGHDHRGRDHGRRDREA